MQSIIGIPIMIARKRGMIISLQMSLYDKNSSKITFFLYYLSYLNFFL